MPRLAGGNSVELPATPPNSAHLRPTRGPDAAFMRPSHPVPLLGDPNAPRTAPDWRASPRAWASPQSPRAYFVLFVASCCTQFRKEPGMTVRIVPSILSADLTRLGE